MTGAAPPEPAPGLHLTGCGPGARLLRRFGIDLREHPRRVAVMLAALTWLPLVVLAGRQGLGALLGDLATHVRLLVALPVLVLLMRPVGAGLAAAAGQFVAADLVRPDQRARFVALIGAGQRLRGSWIAGLVLIAAVGLMTVELFGVRAGYEAREWVMTGDGRTPAGLWYGLVSLPIFHLVWLRWLYVLGLWAHFLARVSRLELRLNPAHPDGAGGLGFLGPCGRPLGGLLFAASAVFAAEVLRRAQVMGVAVTTEWAGAVMLMVVALALFIGPSLAFVPTLIGLRQRGALDYGALASRYTRDFAAKWFAGEGPREALLGTADVQSLSDLASTHDRVRGMRVVPLARRDVVALVVPGLIPLLLLVASTMPIPEVLASLLRIFV